MKQLFTQGIALATIAGLSLPVVFAQNAVDTTIQHSSYSNEVLNQEDLYAKNRKLSHESWLMKYCPPVHAGFVWKEPISLFANQETCKDIVRFSFGNNLAIMSQPQIITSVQTITNNLRDTFAISSHGYQNRFDSVEKILQKMKIFETLKSENANTYDAYVEVLRKIHKEFQNSDFLTMQSKDAFGSAITASLLSVTGKGIDYVQTLAEQEKFFFVTEFIAKVKDLAETDVAYVRFGNNNELYASADLVLPVSASHTNQEKAYFYARNMKNGNIAESDLNISLQNAPEWVKTDGHSLIFTNYPNNESSGTRYTFQMIMTPKNGGKTFTQEVTVTLIDDTKLTGLQSFWEYQKNLQK